MTIRLTKEETTARCEHAFANFETMTRAELQAFCMWNDPNGCYSDEECTNEFGAPATVEDLRDVVRAWKAEG